MAKDYYEILGVSKTATQDEIKKSFRKQAHVHHPDKKSGNEAKFKEINEAYQILGDEQKRKQYDQHGDAAFSGQGFGGTGMNWNDFVRQAQQGQGGGGVTMDFGDLGDIFSEVFGFGGGRRSRQSGPRRGDDMEIEMSVDFLDAVFGVERDIRLNRVATCEHCKGNGAEPGTKISSCDRCKGSGQVMQTRSTMLGTFQSASVCPECRGEGKRAETPCKQCNGAGAYERPEEVKVKIPAGIDNGQTIRLSGLGNAGERGGEQGDLYVHIRVKNHKQFEREGYTIITHEPMSVSQAVLGDTIEVETVHGKVNLKIPAGTQPGTQFKLGTKGVPHVQSSSKGDHIVIAEVRIPSKLSRTEKKLYEDLRDEKGKSWL
ncbi:molecular chaperone DnaJ [bacterium CG10_46_32]|nr:MAG: molecular chaperone DnaJ [bacterium CG10_46_32]PIR55646.1 MAG: molecular chaperone DnaJ [Parcubacteria group bacterium CG10_big_fil_rev_8_21_14_0_10_46_32]